MANNFKECDLECDEINNSDDIWQMMSNLCMNSDHADVMFLVEDNRVPAHKTILSARSPYFHSLLNGGFVESSQSEIKLEVPVVAFREILRYIYTGRVLFVGLDVSQILDICTLADLYGFEPLKWGGFKWFNANISLSNCCEIFDWATKFSLHDVKEVCFEFMERNARLLLNEESLNTLSITALSSLFERKTFCAPEIEIFNAVKNWQAHNKDADVKEVMRRLRWSLISANDLCTIVFPSEILQQADLIKIISEQGEANVQGERLSRHGQIEVPSTIQIDPVDDEPTDFSDPRSFLIEAKRLKHSADGEVDSLVQAILYLESIVQFSFTGLAMECNPITRKSAVTMYRDTLSLLKYLTPKFCNQQRLALEGSLHSKLEALCLRYQSVISLKLFKLRYRDMKQSHTSIESYLDQNNVFPYPSSSSSNSSVNAVLVPMNVLQAVKFHTSIFGYLSIWLDQWERANVAMVRGKNQDWFKQLDEEVGLISVESEFRKSVQYVQAAVQKIKQMRLMSM